MRSVPIIIGSLLMIVSIPTYLYSPHFLSLAVHSFFRSMSNGGTINTSILHQMGYPSMSAVIPIIQYSVIGMAAAGIGFVLFGFVAKKIPKKVVVKLVTEVSDKEKEVHIDSKPTDEKIQTNLRSIRILQERLAKGEISSSEFLNLKRFLE